MTEHCGGLLTLYDNSPSKLISSVYPEHKWLLWKFSRVPSGFWEKSENQRNFLENLASELQIKNIEDWYNVTYNVTIVTNNFYLII